MIRIGREIQCLPYAVFFTGLFYVFSHPPSCTFTTLQHFPDLLYNLKSIFSFNIPLFSSYFPPPFLHLWSQSRGSPISALSLRLLATQNTAPAPAQSRLM